VHVSELALPAGAGSVGGKAADARPENRVAARGGPAGEPTLEAVGPANAPSAPEVEALRRRLVRLALDVHDGPMQGLTAVGFGLRDFERSLVDLPLPDGRHEEISARIADLVGELASAEASLRHLITTLEHGTPEIDSLGEIVTGELERFRRRSKVSVEAAIDPNFQPDTHSQAVAIQSVLREALNNVVKHAHATAVQVRVQPSSTGILIEVEDDGRGFDPAAARAGSIGIVSMRQRVDLLGGEFDLLSRPGGPTVVTAVLRRFRRPAAI
jgi:signal transduction histidine kinase